MTETEIDKDKAVQDVISIIEKKHGKGSIVRLGSKDIVPVSVISTGSIGLDSALGVGGVPRGRIIEIWGPESSGKTTISLHIVAEAQKAGGYAAFVDAEHALDPLYAGKLGVDVDELLLAQPDSGEQALEVVEDLVRSGGVDVIVVDSVAALVPKAELEGEMGDAHVGLHERLMSQAMRKLTAIVSKSNTCLIFINQVREKIGVMYGDSRTTTGGRALKFYASVRMEVGSSKIKEGDEITGSRVKVKVSKNKCAPPFKQAEFDIAYGEGISKIGEILDYGVRFGAVEKSGSWFSASGQRIGQGREAAKAFLLANPELSDELEAKIRSELGIASELPAASKRKKGR